VNGSNPSRNSRDEADAVTEGVRDTMAGALYQVLGKGFPVAVDTRISSHW
jgi:hypothetical protein